MLEPLTFIMIASVLVAIFFPMFMSACHDAANRVEEEKRRKSSTIQFTDGMCKIPLYDSFYAIVIVGTPDETTQLLQHHCVGIRHMTSASFLKDSQRHVEHALNTREDIDIHELVYIEYDWAQHLYIGVFKGEESIYRKTFTC